jgi:hypothetical protein
MGRINYLAGFMVETFVRVTTFVVYTRRLVSLGIPATIVPD